MGLPFDRSHGACERPWGPGEAKWHELETSILPSIMKAKYLWKGHAKGIRKKASFKSIITPHLRTVCLLGYCLHFEFGNVLLPILIVQQDYKIILYYE